MRPLECAPFKQQLLQQRDPVDPRVPALLDWLERLEMQRYAPKGRQGGQLGTLKTELKRLMRRN